MALAAATCLAGPPAAAQEPARPNILVIFGDDIGQSNLSASRWG
jgi:arylsulfatase